MDAQMKRGFLEACVLASIRNEDSYGYRILKDVPDVLGLTESTLYPLLKRLEAAGLLTVRSVEHNGRLRKYYRITPEGRARLDEFVAEWDDVQAIYRFIRGGEARSDA
ncbi:MAG TPA: PadR family transcriptional regulator [Candidatus Rubneribacter avistercoris]|nr:PadR family transcriptional regulator [Candidatus Rubneribacter avistercoris]